MDSARFGAEYLDRISEHLYSSVLADILDEAGHRQQVMRPEVRPLYPGAKVAGRAATMLAVEVSELPAQPYHLLMEMLDGLRQGEVIVADSDGCVVVPAAIEDDIIAKAMEKVSGEDKMRDVLRKGASIREVFKDYGIL